MTNQGSIHKVGSVEIHQIPARADNYIYLIRDTVQNLNAIVDPGVHEPVVAYLEERDWKADRILVTHHHYDHIDGIPALQERYGSPVSALHDDSFRIKGVTDFFEKEKVYDLFDHSFKVMFTPGHTLGHICLYFENLKLLFCGDTLFSFGCGKLFEGTAPMMFATFQKLRALPADTFFFCGHEYTLTNLEFAMSLEPGSPALQKMHVEIAGLRQQGLPTVPARLKREFELNPFFRWDDSALRKALNMENAADVDVFAAVRGRRNHW